MKYKLENVLSCSYVSMVQVYLEAGGVLVLSGAWNVSRGKGGRFWEVSRTKEDPPGSGPRIRIVMLPETEGEGGKVAVPFELALFAHVPDVGDLGELGWFEEVGGRGGRHVVDRAGTSSIDGVQVSGAEYLVLEDRRRDHLNMFSFFAKQKETRARDKYLSHVDSHRQCGSSGGGITDHMEV